MRSRSPSSSIGNITSTRRWKLRGIQSAADEVDLALAAVLEAEDARVLEEAVDDAGDPDVVADARDAGAEAADAAHDEVDLHARLRGAVERLDDRRVDERVHLGDDASACRPSAASRSMRAIIRSCSPSGRDEKLFHAAATSSR